MFDTVGCRAAIQTGGVWCILILDKEQARKPSGCCGRNGKSGTGFTDMRTGTDDIVPWIALNLLIGQNSDLGWTIVRRIHEMDISLDEFLAMDPERRAAQFPDDVTRVCYTYPLERLLDDAGELLDIIEDSGVTVVRSSDPYYPQRFVHVAGRAVPPVLYISGNADIFHGPSIGIVGSRAATRTGLDFAWSLARTAAERGCVVVSGGATGIDSAAHRGAVDGGGRTVVVLPHGLARRRARQALAQHPDQVTLVSQFPPQLGASARTALGRNRTIAGLSGAVVAVESAAAGGTMSTATHARSLSVPLFAVAWEDDAPIHQGTRKLIDDDAHPLPPVIRDQPDLDQLFETIS